jgi:hypothetical protein
MLEPTCPRNRLCHVTQKGASRTSIADATQLRFELVAVDDRELHRILSATTTPFVADRRRGGFDPNQIKELSPNWRNTLALPSSKPMCRQGLGDRWREPFILHTRYPGSPHRPILAHMRFATIDSCTTLFK